MRNVSLCKTLKDYCIAVLAMVNEKIKVEELPYRTKEKFEITESNGFSQSYVAEIDWRWLVYKFEGDFKAMDAYKSAARALKEDEHVSKHLNNLVGTRQGGSWRIDCEWILLSLLRQLLSDLRGLEFQEAIFDKVYGDMEDYFYRDMIEVRFLAPLKSFKMQADKIEISPGFFIIRIPKKEKEEMLSQSREFFLSLEAMDYEFAFELNMEVPKIIGDPPAIPAEQLPSRVAEKDFYEACSALRLFKNGMVGYKEVWSETKSWPSTGFGIAIDLGKGDLSLEAAYFLSKEEISDFLQLLRFYQKVRQKPLNRIDIALRRFNFAYFKVTPEDRLIDYIIGFEALLLQDEPQELAYRMALRGAALLGKNPNERKKIFDELKAAYNKRNDIVHGKKIKDTVHVFGEKIPFREFVKRVEGYLRSVTKAFLVLCETKSESQIIEYLQEKIVAGTY